MVFQVICCVFRYFINNSLIKLQVYRICLIYQLRHIKVLSAYAANRSGYSGMSANRYIMEVNMISQNYCKTDELIVSVRPILHFPVAYVSVSRADQAQTYKAVRIYQLSNSFSNKYELKLNWFLSFSSTKHYASSFRQFGLKSTFGLHFSYIV